MNKIMCTTNRSHLRRTGNVLLIFVLTLVPIMGFAALAVDYGVLVNDKNRLQRACDAAALAGAQELKMTGDDNTDTSNATSEAIATAGQNDVSITSSDISFTNNNSDITVSASLTRGLFFARVLDIMTGDVGASATAGVGGVGANYTPYVAPVGIVEQDYNSYKYDASAYDASNSKKVFDIIRHNKHALGTGEFVVFDLRSQPSKSGHHMQIQLTGDEIEHPTIYDPNVGCTGTSCQTSLNASLHSEGRKVNNAINTLISRAAGSPWHDDGDSGWYDKMRLGQASYSNPRVINIIVTVNSAARNGTSNMPVLAFVPVYIDSYNNRTGNLTVQFLPTPQDMETDLVTGSSTRKLQLLN